MPFQVLLNQLRAVFDQIIELQNAQDAMYRAALEELQRRLQFEEKKKQREIEVGMKLMLLLLASHMGGSNSFSAEISAYTEVVCSLLWVRGSSNCCQIE